MSESIPGPDIPAEAAPAEWTAPSRLWLAALAAGVLATALTWAAGEATADFFRSKEVKDPLTEVVDSAGIIRIAVNNAALAHGLQGALLGLTLGLAAGAAARRPARAVATAGLAGLVSGGVLGAAASIGLSTVYFATTDANTQSLLPSLLMHAGIASLLGAAGGAAFGLGLGGRRRVAKAAVGGLVGAAVGAGLYDVVGALLFPIDKTGDPVAASGMARLLWHTLIDLFAAFGAAALVLSAGTKDATIWHHRTPGQPSSGRA